MNKAAYDKLPADLKKVIDANSGIETAALFGRAMDAGDITGKAAAQKAGNNIVALDAAETQRWARAAAGVRAVWFQQAAEKGIDGPEAGCRSEATDRQVSEDNQQLVPGHLT